MWGDEETVRRTAQNWSFSIHKKQYLRTCRQWKKERKNDNVSGKLLSDRDYGRGGGPA